MPYLRLLGAQAAIGAAAIFARYALTAAGPLAVSALRLGIAALVALVAVRFGRAGFGRIGRRRELAMAAAGLALAAHFAAWIASLRFTSVAISTLLVTTTPLWTECFDVVRERRPPSRGFLAALACGLAGVALVALQRGGGTPPVPGHEAFGDALALAGSVAIGAYLLIVRDAGHRDGERMPTATIVARTYAWSALAAIVAATFAGQGPPPLGAGTAWAGIVAMALVSQSLGHTALNAALRDFSPSTIALTTLLEPVVAAVLAALLFAERIAPAAIAGGVLVLLAVALVLRDAKPAEAPAPRSRAARSQKA